MARVVPPTLSVTSDRTARWASWGLIGVGLVLVAAFVELGQEVVEKDGTAATLQSLDTDVLRGLAELRRPWLSAIAMDLTALGSPILVALVTCVSGALLLTRDDRRGAMALAAVSLVSAAVTFVAKGVLERPRPSVVPRLVDVTGLSYPSGHSVAAAAMYLTLAWVVARRLGSTWQKVASIASAAVLVLSIALSRVYLGVHYPSDIVGGLLLGAAIACVAWVGLRSAGQGARPP